MAVEVVVGDHEQLLVKEGRNNISLIFFKFIGVIFLAGAIFYLSVSNFNTRMVEIEKFSMSLEKQDVLNIMALTKESAVKEKQLKKGTEVCDLWVGEWIPNAAEPAYTHTCNLILPFENCVRNGRPDTSYLHWRWKPNSCDLPPIDPLKFLNEMRNKSFAFIGDSICHSLLSSLMCHLSKVAKVYDVYHNPSFTTRTWYYPSHNVTLYMISSLFLIHYETVDNHGDASQIHLHLHLDILDSKWTSEYNKYDYVVISIGPHFFRSSIIYENNQVIGCHHCPHLNLKKFGIDELYRKALHLSLNFIAKSEHKTFVILKTWSPDHSEHGELPSAIHRGNGLGHSRRGSFIILQHCYEESRGRGV
ncbi:protein trichome birefringence-like 25 [Dioscorea cayenensis subsp. rotundata]|uniref:Protein trichome birefringence-like 25 n=1 Tax=Dioscorea cayennensis subsp. rotundata TaxID=55577 RepID=A0AB40AT86_DIOCR|nr:protein trichome birefringence-like 25 [Dioscorea cayenensis subsp. rotundata]